MKVFDIETDGLLDTVSKIHCINVADVATGRRFRFNCGTYHDGTPSMADGSIEDGVRFLHDAEVAGQNVIGYDIPAIQKLYPWFKPRKVFDTKIAAQVIWTNLADIDLARIRKGAYPADFQSRGLIGRNSLEAWGARLGFEKGDFDPKDYGHTWATVPFMRDMDVYCDRDVDVTVKWIEQIEAKNFSPECLDLEMRVAEIVKGQELHGFAFDVAAAERLACKLQVRKAELDAELQDVFPPWRVLVKRAIAHANNKKLGRVKGEPYEVWKEVVFNPASRDHIADRLMKLRGWKPNDFTDNGKPQVDETVLEALPWPEAKVLSEYFLVTKRLGQVLDGAQAWLKKQRNGRIHGTVNTNGAVTGRMTHSNPNVAQVPKVGVAYGEECRACFTASEGKLLVGCDAEGLELRALAHFMAKWDGGAYGEAVVNGRKEDETDVHNVNKRAAGLNKRDSSKTFIYALIYGAGDHKLGAIVFEDFTDDQRSRFLAKYATQEARDKALKALGKKRRAAIMTNLPALGELISAVKKRVKSTGQLKGIDGRVLHVRSEHSALNTLLQSAGAVAMKKALVIFADKLEESPAYRGRVHFVANIHDEFQIETDPEIAHEIGALAAECIRLAGEHFRFRCPLAGAFEVGRTWADTH